MVADIAGRQRATQQPVQQSSEPVAGRSWWGWRGIRVSVVVAYVATLIVLAALHGVPTSRLPLASMIVVGLLLTRIGTSWSSSLRVLLDWAPFTAVLVLYDETRGLADTLGVPLHETDVVRAEDWLFGGTNPTVWLQHQLYDPAHPLQVHWYDAICTLVYTTHFIATPIVAALLWLRSRRLFLRYVSRVVLLSCMGLVTYVLFPEAPPWLAADDGHLPPVARLSARGWVWLHAGNLNDLLARAQSTGSNAVAAMPSLHTAFATTIALFVGSCLRTRWRYLLALYPLVMAFTLVYTGEHYVLDVVAGALYAVVAHLAVRAWERRRAARATPGSPVGSDAGAGHGADPRPDTDAAGAGAEAEGSRPRG